MKFSIKALFLILTLFCMVCILICHRVDRQRRAISIIVSDGGVVGFTDTSGVVLASENTFLNNLFGTAKDAAVDPARFDKNTMTALNELPDLKTISLVGSSSDSIQYKLEQQFPNIEIIDLAAELMKSIE